MKKAYSIVLDILLFFIILLLCGNLSAKPIVVSTITQSLVGDHASQQMMDIVLKEFPNADTNTLQNVQNALEKSPSLKKITGKYLDEVIASIAAGKQMTYPDLSADMDTLLEENLDAVEKYIGTDINDSQKQKIKSELKEKSGEIEKALQETTGFIADGSTGINTKILSAYRILEGTAVRVGCIVGMMVVIVLQVIGKKSIFAVMEHIGTVCILAGAILIVVLPNVLKGVASNLADVTLGGHYVADFSNLIVCGLVSVVIGLVLFLAHLVYTVRYKKKHPTSYSLRR